MYAIVKDGSRQIKVTEGSLIALDRKPMEPGETLSLSSVLMLHDDKGVHIGEPLLKNVTVTARVEQHFRDRKIIVYKFKRRKNYRRKQGHRQSKTLVKVHKIEVR